MAEAWFDIGERACVFVGMYSSPMSSNRLMSDQ